VAGSTTNGKQHHLSTREIVALAFERRAVRWHWAALDSDFLVRPRTTAENAAVVEESNRHNAAIEEYRGTPDEPTPLDAMRIKVRASLPCLLWPDDRTPVFAYEDLDTLLEMDTVSLMEMMNKVDEVSNFTQAQAEKNSAAMVDASTSSGSPEGVATSSPSPTPIR
jgi:hypothetical protein